MHAEFPWNLARSPTSTKCSSGVHLSGLLRATAFAVGSTWSYFDEVIRDLTRIFGLYQR